MSLSARLTSLEKRTPEPHDGRLDVLLVYQLQPGEGGFDWSVSEATEWTSARLACEFGPDEGFDAEMIPEETPDRDRIIAAIRSAKSSILIRDDRSL